jgi:hypothetical protein
MNQDPCINRIIQYWHQQMHTCKLKFFYTYNELGHVSIKCVVVLRDIKYKVNIH